MYEKACKGFNMHRKTSVHVKKSTDKSTCVEKRMSLEMRNTIGIADCGIYFYAILNDSASKQSVFIYFIFIYCVIMGEVNNSISDIFYNL